MSEVFSSVWDVKSSASEEVLEREAEDVSVNCEEGREIVPSVALGRCIPFFCRISQ